MTLWPYLNSGGKSKLATVVCTGWTWYELNENKRHRVPHSWHVLRMDKTSPSPKIKNKFPRLYLHPCVKVTAHILLEFSTVLMCRCTWWPPIQVLTKCRGGFSLVSAELRRHWCRFVFWFFHVVPLRQNPSKWETAAAFCEYKSCQIRKTNYNVDHQTCQWQSNEFVLVCSKNLFSFTGAFESEETQEGWTQ